MTQMRCKTKDTQESILLPELRIIHKRQAEEQLLYALQQFTEKQLIDVVILPLLKKLGYQRIEFHGGPYEDGKDIICWMTDEFDEIRLVVIQVKLYKPSANVKDSMSLSLIVGQLIQASEKPVPNLEGQSTLPYKVIFITPFPVKTRAIESRHESLTLIKTRNLHIYDGPKLVELVNNKLPELAISLCGKDFAIRPPVLDTLNNRVLLEALNYRGEKDISQLYTDLKFSSERIIPDLFRSTFRPCKMTLNLIKQDYTEIEQCRQQLQALTNHDFAQIIKLPPEKQLKQMNIACLRFSPIRVILQILLDNIYLFSHASDSSTSWNIRLVACALISLFPHKKNRHKGQVMNLCSNDVDIITTNDAKIEYEHKLEEVKLQLAGTIRDKLHDYGLDYESISVTELNTALRPIMEQVLLRSREPVQEITGYLNSALSSIPEQTYSVVINGGKLAKYIESQRSLIIQKTREFSESTPHAESLIDLINECYTLHKVAGIICSQRELMLALGGDPKLSLEDPTEFTVSYSIRQIMSGCKALTILGEAGAGKTTTLQMYTFEKLTADEQSCIIYLSLGRLVIMWNQYRSNNLAKESEMGKSGLSSKFMNAGKTIPFLEEGLLAYFHSIKVAVSLSELNEVLAYPKVSLLLDGVDEALGRAPWIVDSIVDFVERHPTIQVITSSRTSGNINITPFPSIVLLPFTPSQRNQYFGKWFGEQNTAYIKSINLHLFRHPEIGEIVRSPLLATIMCVLAENEMPLPETEVRLYDERMSLLMGRYDTHKKVQRIKSQRHVLELVSRKLAFAMHTDGVRAMSFASMQAAVWKSTYGKYELETIRLALEELIYPCNILMPMVEGDYGFGHLRFQEYLASVETCRRNVNMASLIENEWWNGVLILHAQMADDLNDLIEAVAKIYTLESVPEIVVEMISQRTKTEQERYYSILKG